MGYPHADALHMGCKLVSTDQLIKIKKFSQKNSKLFLFGYPRSGKFRQNKIQRELSRI